MVFACEKFRPYILGSHVIIHTDHAAIKDKKHSDNVIADHLSRLEKTAEKEKGNLNNRKFS